MSSQLTYRPADPLGVASVDRLRLYTSSTRTGTPTVDVGPAVQQPDLSWVFTIPDGITAGTYYVVTSVSYSDTTTAEDSDDTVTLPLLTAAQLGDPLALWVPAADVAAAVTGSSTEEATQAAQVATDVLYVLSGRQYPGARIGTLRVPPTTTGPRVSLPIAAPWAGAVSRLDRGGCCATHFDPLLYPIRSVVRLTVGGVDIPAEQIDVEGQRIIRILRGSTADPLAVNYALGSDGAYSLWPGGGCGCGRPAIEVTLTWGRDVPAGGKASAKLFAVELLKAIKGDSGCRLPGNLVSVNRQGVSIVLDPTTFLDKKRTGIPFADTWLAAVNPNGLKAAPLLWWPDSPLPEVVG